MIGFIRSLLNINKKLYIIVNSNVSKGKIARVCATIGMQSTNFRFNPVIVVKTEKIEEIMFGIRSYMLNNTKPDFLEHNDKIKITGTHIDAGLTQCKAGTLLAVGLVVNKNNKINLKLY